MNKLFAALLFFCVVGASVLWWLMKTLPENQENKPEIKNEEVLKEEDNIEEDLAEEAKFILRIDSAPGGAKVEVDGVYQGTTPVDIDLGESRAQAKIILEGYEIYTRQVPSIEDADVEELVWKVTLKEKASEKKLQRSDLYRGSVSGYFIQLRALRAVESTDEDLVNQLEAYRTKLSTTNVKLCLANLGPKGKWYRVLVGPYKSSSSAKSAVDIWKSKLGSAFEGFITGRQNCL